MSQYTNAEQMAFPVQVSNLGGALYAEKGLSKREYAAIKIMAGFASNPEDYRTLDAYHQAVKSNAVAAVDWADALLCALEATPAARSAP